MRLSARIAHFFIGDCDFSQSEHEHTHSESLKRPTILHNSHRNNFNVDQIVNRDV